MRIVTFGCPTGETDCSGDFAVTFTVIMTPDQNTTIREVLIFGMDRSDPAGGPRVRTVLWGVGGQVAGGFGTEFLEGGPSQFPVILWADGPKGEFLAWSPAN